MNDAQEIDSLQKLLAVVTQQRDAALMRLSFSEEEIKVVGLRAAETAQGVVVEVAHQALEDWAIAMCDSFINGGGVNYFVVGVRDPRNGDEYEISMQKRTGSTPIELHQAAKLRIAELEAQLDGHGA